MTNSNTISERIPAVWNNPDLHGILNEANQYTCSIFEATNIPVTIPDSRVMTIEDFVNSGLFITITIFMGIVLYLVSPWRNTNKKWDVNKPEDNVRELRRWQSQQGYDTESNTNSIRQTTLMLDSYVDVLLRLQHEGMIDIEYETSAMIMQSSPSGRRYMMLRNIHFREDRFRSGHIPIEQHNAELDTMKRVSYEQAQEIEQLKTVVEHLQSKLLNDKPPVIVRSRNRRNKL